MTTNNNDNGGSSAVTIVEAEKTACAFRAIGFCGADDSVHPNMLVMMVHSFPLIEFGVLFRPDKEGEPRYATADWVERLGKAVASCNKKQMPVLGRNMKLAAHLCGSCVNDVLSGTAAGDDFLRNLVRLGFQRVQINATAVNGVDTSRLKESVPTFLQRVERLPCLEFIIQKNDETQPLWSGILELAKPFPKNLSMLVDESKGTGVAPTKSWPSPPDDYEIGYAGGIGPHNIHKVFKDVQKAVPPGRSVWIDMESSLRSTKNGRDVFDLDKCYEVIHAACELGIMEQPDYLSC